MKITLEEVQHVAKLARLELSEAEAKDMAGQLDTILAYVEKLEELDTSGVAPAGQVGEQSNAFREDVCKPSLDIAEALRNGPNQDGQAFVVPRVI